MISIPVCALEFVDQGNTIWVHNYVGANVMRIKTMGRITTNGECENICSHVDIVVKNNIHICLSEDAKEVTDLDRLKQTYDQLGIQYEELVSLNDNSGNDLIKLCLPNGSTFIFNGGKLVSQQ